ncbi:DUF1990 domain-containing protein [Candidatus Uabimicrobium amorphum]
MPKLIEEWRSKPLTYTEIGCTRFEQVPPGYNKDKHRILLGKGESTFDKAKCAIQNWKMYDLGWMDVHRPVAPIQEGEVSVTFIKLFGIWFSAIPCRIVYTIDETNNNKSLFGFGFGTVQDHPEIGEEKFLIEWDHNSDSVYYEVCAISRSGHFLTKCGYPVMRCLQKRFFRDTLQSILRNSKVD